MKGYPRNPNVLTKADILNLLSMPEYAEKAAKDLTELAKINDSKITVNEGTQEQPDVKQVDNPFPSWKRTGFRSKEEMLTIAKVKLEPAPIEEPIEKGG